MTKNILYLLILYLLPACSGKQQEQSERRQDRIAGIGSGKCYRQANAGYVYMEQPC